MKTWFITGASRGLGLQWALAALDRGDRVAAAVRNPGALDDLIRTYGAAVLPLRLDVTDRAACFAAVRKAHEHFGRLDIVVNNAGYGQYGFIEELSEDEARAQMETNFFGALWVTQAALPYLRVQRSGHIIQVSSIGGITAFANLGAYHASKWALEGMTQSLAQEVSGFGIRVTLVEPSGFATDWVLNAPQSTPLAAYDRERTAFESARQERNTVPGDPASSRAAILRIVDAPEPPLRVFFGDRALEWARRDYADRLATWETWQHVALEAQGEAQPDHPQSR